MTRLLLILCTLAALALGAGHAPVAAHHAALLGGDGTTPWYSVVPGAVFAYQAKGAASLAASYVNLANPGTYDLTTTSAPAWDTALGWTFTNDFLSAGCVPTDSTHTILVAFSGSSATGITALAFAADATYSHGIFNAVGIDNVRRYRNIETLTQSGDLTGGVMGYAGTTAYLDGASDGTIAPSANVSTGAWFLGCREIAGVKAVYFDGTIIAAIYYETALSGPDVATVTAAMQGL